MHPVLKRILIQGGLTAALLALLGVVFAEMSGVWAAGGGRPGSANLNPPLPESLRYRIPLTMALAGFLFVAAGEGIMYRIRGRKQAALAAKPAEPQQQQPDDVEKLLNELLAQAEAKKAAEQEQQKTVTGEQKAEDRGGSLREAGGDQKPEDGQKTEEGEKKAEGEKQAEEPKKAEAEKPGAPAA